jgi:peptidase C39-like protein
MPRVTRQAFVDGFGAVNLEDVDAARQEELTAAGVSTDDLKSIAGPDGVISGDGELSRLFDLLDRVDHDGSRNSIETVIHRPDGAQVETPSGELFEALCDVRERARLGGTVQPTITSAPGGKGGTAPTPPTTPSLTELQAAGFTEVHLSNPLPYYDQGRGPWARHPYPKTPPEPGTSRTIQNAGCAPTALAMADAGLRHARTTPVMTADFAVRGGFSGRGGHGGQGSMAGSDTMGLGRAWAHAHGLSFTAATSRDQGRNVDAVKAGVDAKGYGIVSVGADRRTGVAHFSKTGHVVVIDGWARRDGQDWFSVVDPGLRDHRHPKTSIAGLDANVVQIGRTSRVEGRVWISRAQLEAEMTHGFVLGPEVQA